MKKCIRISITLLLAIFLIACKTPTEIPETPTATTEESAVSTTAPTETTAVDETIPDTSSLMDHLDGRTLNEFQLDITLDTTQHKLTIIQKLAYHNNTSVELSEIYFNLVPNYFQDKGGGIQMGTIRLDDTEETMLTHAEGTVYKMPLPTPLSPNETRNIEMTYDINIPNIQNRFGYQDTLYNVGNFIVTPAVYQADGWAIEPYVDLGDAFYTDIANYTVTFHVPQDYVIAATGIEISPGCFQLENARDFAFCANNSYKTLSDTVGKTAITVYYNDDMHLTADRVLETAKKALPLYSDLFGEYPYETLSIVLAGLTGGVSGMEYPTLIMVGPEITMEALAEFELDLEDQEAQEEYNRYPAIIDRTVVHEIAHQWFYGIVGNDQIKYPWLDEGLCRFSEYLYERAYPPAYPDGSVENMISDMYEYVTDEDNLDTTNMNHSLYDWVSGDDPMGYGFVYYKSASIFYEMMKQMGQDNFDIALREYVSEFAYEFVTPEKFKDFWNEREAFSTLFELYFKDVAPYQATY